MAEMHAICESTSRFVKLRFALMFTLYVNVSLALFNNIRKVIIVISSEFL